MGSPGALLLVGEVLGELVADGDAVDQMSAEYRGTLCRAFHELDLTDRRVLVARHVDQLSEAEVSAELNIPLLDVDKMASAAEGRFVERKDALLRGDPEGRSR